MIMKAKVSFGCILFIQPEILIIDEVLGVGDAEFSKKSIEKTRELCNAGKILLMVSHSMGWVCVVIVHFNIPSILATPDWVRFSSLGYNPIIVSVRQPFDVTWCLLGSKVDIAPRIWCVNKRICATACCSPNHCVSKIIRILARP